jgi:hypothetical protein
VVPGGGVNHGGQVGGGLSPGLGGSVVGGSVDGGGELGGSVDGGGELGGSVDGGGELGGSVDGGGELGGSDGGDDSAGTGLDGDGLFELAGHVGAGAELVSRGTTSAGRGGCRVAAGRAGADGRAEAARCGGRGGGRLDEACWTGITVAPSGPGTISVRQAAPAISAATAATAGPNSSAAHHGCLRYWPQSPVASQDRTPRTAAMAPPLRGHRQAVSGLAMW